MLNLNYDQINLNFYKQQKIGQEFVSIFHHVHTAKRDTVYLDLLIVALLPCILGGVTSRKFLYYYIVQS